MQALQQVLAEVLQAAVEQQQKQQQRARRQAVSQGACGDAGEASGECARLQALLGQQPHWAAVPEAVARHPALHLVARQALHEWLAASGNPEAWRLLLLLLRAARCGGTQQPAQAQGQLPAGLAALYSAGLAGAAALLHAEQPTEAGLQAAVAQLQAFLAPPAEQALASALDASAAAAQRQQQAWQLQLDAPAWLLACLRRLPLQHLLSLAEAGGAAAGGTAAAAEAATGSPAAAAYAALALWPGEPRRQGVLREALQLELSDVDLPSLRPWLLALHSWQALLADAAAVVDCGEAAATPAASDAGDASDDDGSP